MPNKGNDARQQLCSTGCQGSPSGHKEVETVGGWWVRPRVYFVLPKLQKSPSFGRVLFVKLL